MMRLYTIIILGLLGTQPMTFAAESKPGQLGHSPSVLAACQQFKDLGTPASERIKDCGCLAKHVVHSLRAPYRHFDLFSKERFGEPELYKFYIVAAVSGVFPHAVECFSGGSGYSKRRVKKLPPQLRVNSLFTEWHLHFQGENHAIAIKPGANNYMRKHYGNPECLGSWKKLGRLVDNQPACALSDEVNHRGLPSWMKTAFTSSDKTCSLEWTDWTEPLPHKCALLRYGVLTDDEARLRGIVRGLTPSADRVETDCETILAAPVERIALSNEFNYSSVMTARHWSMFDLSHLRDFGRVAKRVKANEQCFVEFFENTFLGGHRQTPKLRPEERMPL